MDLADLDASSFSPLDKTAEEQEALVLKVNEILTAKEEDDKDRYCMAAVDLFKDWTMKLGASHRSTLHLGLVLTRHLNSLEEDEPTELAFSLACEFLPHMQTVFGERDKHTLVSMLLQGELFAKLRVPDRSYLTLVTALDHIKAEAAATKKNASEIYGTLEAEICLVLGKVEVERSHAEEALGHFRRSVELAREVPRSPEQRKVLIDTLIAYAHFAMECGAASDEEALDLFIEARSRAEEDFDEDPENCLQIMTEVADQYRKSGNPKKAVAELGKVKTLSEERFPPAHRQVILAKANVAALLAQQDYVEQAQAILEEVMPLARGTKLECSIQESLAAIYADIGRQQAAEVLLSRNIVTAKELFGEASDGVVDALRSKAALLASIGRLDEAMGLLNQALALNEDIETGIPYNVFELRELAAKITLDMKDFAEARAHAQAMLDLRMEAVGRSHPLTADVLFLQARIEVREDPSVALELIREALDIHEEYYHSKAHQQTAEMLEAAAELLFDDEGEYDEAIEMQRKAVKMHEELYGELAPDTITATLTLAGLLQQTGEDEAGIAMVKKVISDLEGTNYHLYLAMAYATLADVDTEDPHESILANQRALEELQKMERPHELRVTVNQSLAALFLDERDYEKGIRYQTAACEAAKAISGETSGPYAEQLHCLAELMIDVNQPDRAIALMDEATAIRHATNADEDEIAEGLLVVAAALQTAGRQQEAVAKYEEAVELTAKLDNPEVISNVLSHYGAFLLDGSPEEMSKGADMLERAHPYFIELADLPTVATIPIDLFRGFPEQAMRWMAVFEAAMDCLQEFRDEFDQMPELAEDFDNTLAEVRAQLQGRITKAAF